jgi:hypothetical protein
MSGVFGTVTLTEFITSVPWLGLEEQGDIWVKPIVAFFEFNGLKVAFCELLGCVLQC